MIYWGTNYDGFLSIFRKFGAVVDLRPLKGQKLGQTRDNRQRELVFDEKLSSGWTGAAVRGFDED
jgi:hypothetical protein